MGRAVKRRPRRNDADLISDLVHHAITKQVTVSMLGQTFRTCEMALPDATRAARLAHGIDLEHQQSRFIPLGALSLSVEKPHVNGEMFFVVAGQRGCLWHLVGQELFYACFLRESTSRDFCYGDRDGTSL
jgi:hypothetical protein